MPSVRRSQSLLMLGMLGMLGCTAVPESPPTPSREPAQLPAPAQLPGPPQCRVPRGSEEQEALAVWLARNPVPEAFNCPAALRVVQREDWWIPFGELLGDHETVSQANIGERVVYAGVDPRSGDRLTAAIGRVNPVKVAAAIDEGHKRGIGRGAVQTFAEAELLVGSWRGLEFDVRARDPDVLALRGWLAGVPGGRQIQFHPIDASSVIEPELVSRLPRLMHVSDGAQSTICVEAAVMRCWTTPRVEIDDTRIETVDDERDDEQDEEEDVAPARAVELMLWTGTRVEWWRLDLAAGAWKHTGSNPRRHRYQRERGKSSRRLVAAAALPPLPTALHGAWARSLANEWIVGGVHGYDSQGVVPHVRWVLRRDGAGWVIGDVDREDTVAELLALDDPTAFALLLGSDPRPSGDGIAGSDRRLQAYVAEGVWLLPAGHLPRGTHRMDMQRGEGGSEYTYTPVIRRPRCITLTLTRNERWSEDWEADADAPVRTTLPSPPHQPDLSGAWRLGPEGFVRGC